ncbi:MAG: hypothetical protein U5R31_09215 [Acidimicrobiia bacterium]|nr:hypothetical protein [Acidimicrobiia bacterium]
MRAKIRRPNILWRAFVLGGLGTLGVLSVSDDAWEAWEENVTDAVPRDAMRAVFFGSVGLHLFEALLARRWTKKAGVPGARGAHAHRPPLRLPGHPTTRVPVPVATQRELGAAA